MLRDAATLILFKKEQSGLRVLMGLRNADHRFLPNRIVFPGGGVDPADYHAKIASPLPAQARLGLERAAPPELAMALACAAARELEEETGLSLGSPPELAEMHYLCRAITPEAAPIRFDARFFVASAEIARGSIGGSGELERLEWYDAEALLQLQVPFVTREVLMKLQHWLDLDATGRPERKIPVFRYPNWSEE